MSRFDKLYRKLILTNFFTKGWGNPDNLKRIFEFRKILSKRELCQKMVASDYPIYIDKEETQKECRILHGHFTSPFIQQLPGIMPKEGEIANFEVILPKVWKGPLKPVCIHLAGTGDHGFLKRRALLARPLLKEAGIASILLENPYYGLRKPKKQLRSSLHNVSDLFVMGGALVLESLALLHWCERQGFGPLGITGISMGGHMASLAATNWHKPLSLIPCLSWTTASPVFTQGVLSNSLPWKLLEDQYLSNSVYGQELSKLIISPEKNRNSQAFQLGQQFVKNYPYTIDDVKEIQTQEHGQSYKNPERLEFETLIKDTGITQQSMPAVNNINIQNLEPQINEDNKVVTSFTKSSDWNLWPKKSAPKDKKLQEQTLDFMRGAMDECTHLGNFSVPVDSSLIIIVLAKNDAYIPRDSVLGLTDLWPGSEVRYVNRGHITSFLFQQDAFRKAIIDSFNRQTEKYFS